MVVILMLGIPTFTYNGLVVGLDALLQSDATAKNAGQLVY
jgi:hypothetical protein